jgi:hypothetical protein
VCNPRRSQLAPQYSRALLPNHPGDDPSSRPRIPPLLILSHKRVGAGTGAQVEHPLARGTTALPFDRVRSLLVPFAGAASRGG